MTTTTTPTYLALTDYHPDQFAIGFIEDRPFCWTATHLPTGDWTTVATGKTRRKTAERAIRDGDAARSIAWKRAETLVALLRQFGFCDTPNVPGRIHVERPARGWYAPAVPHQVVG